MCGAAYGECIAAYGECVAVYASYGECIVFVYLLILVIELQVIEKKQISFHDHSPLKQDYQIQYLFGMFEEAFPPSLPSHNHQ